MKKLLLLICLSILWNLPVFAQSPELWDNLAVLKLKCYSCSDITTGGLPNALVRYNKNVSKIINQTIPSKDDFSYISALQFQLTATSPESYLLTFDEGSSADPTFTIYQQLSNGEKREIFKQNGLEIVLPGNGHVYVSGHTNNMFNMRRKFEYNHDTLIEIKQPFYYVGLVTQTTQPIILYDSLEYHHEVAKLPAGHKIEILVNLGDNYLVKTSFGLTGWLKIHEGTMSDQTPVTGIFFAGD
jgi:hypothetical protein